MATSVSNCFRKRRIEKNLGLGEMARKCGYKNVAKGANRIQRFEDQGEITADLQQKLAVALDITEGEIRSCIAQDKAEWERWANEPIEPHLVVRLMAAVYSRKNIPSDLHSQQEAMEQFASEFARDKGFRVCLVLSLRLRVWFDRDGKREGETVDTSENSSAPYMQLNGSGKKFHFSLLNEESA